MHMTPVVLEGSHVRLEPLAMSHYDGLCEAIADGELWTLFVTIVPKLEEVETFVQNAINLNTEGSGLAFATIHRETNTVVGSTRFMKLDAINQRVEIGFTFIGQTWQKTLVNTEAKLLMLTHAFDILAMNRVEFLTDYLNANSRRAILRLGAKEEGILRNHMVMADGRIRDSVIFSVLKHEWPGVQQNLATRLT